MNKIQELAYRNVRKYKKHYLFVSILIFCVSIFFLSYTMIFNNHYEVKKMYNQEKYGEWYFHGTLPTEEIPLFEKLLSNYEIDIKYCYLYDQGRIDNNLEDNKGITDNWIVSASDDNIYDLYSLKLIEGRELEKEDEILITNLYQEKNNIELNDQIELTINNSIGKYKVVGILNVNNESSPSIYTNIKESQEAIFLSNFEISGVYSTGDDSFSSLNNTFINANGYTIGSVAKLSHDIEQIIIVTESLILTVFALIALNFTSLKRRSKEFALLRGIGMTNKQLFAMIMYEILYTVLFNVILAIGASFLASYMGSIILEKVYGYYLYNVNITQFLLYLVILVSSILVSLLYPVYSSTRTALTGTFDSQTFQKIQVRYRNLKYQNKYRLALRELGAHKKFTLTLLCIFILVDILYMTSLVNVDELDKWKSHNNGFISFNYYEEISWTQEDVDELSKLYADKDIQIYKKGFFKQEIDKSSYLEFEGGVYLLDKDLLSKNCIIEGRMPINDNEVLFVQNHTWLNIVEEVYNEGYLMQDYTIYQTFNVGDTFLFKGKEYTFVGAIKPNEKKKTSDGWYVELHYAPSGVYVTENTFNEWQDCSSNISYDFRIYYEEESEGEEIVNKYVEKYGFKPISSNSYFEAPPPPEDLLNISPKLLILPVLVGFIFIYYLNKNHMINNSQDIALSKLIGMTNKEIMLKQLYKVLILTGIVISFEVFWIVMLNLYYRLVFIPVLEFILSVLVILSITITIYCLPMKDILNNNIFDLIHSNE